MAANLQCTIVGEGALPIVCAEILMEGGHEILAVVSPDPDVSQWARSQGIAHAIAPSALLDLMEGRPFDYLFSITNFQKLPDAIINAAACGAINYHDAPLPRYAGSHATSWALLSGEASHAVTWHRLTSRIDAGDILRQVPVDIDPDDTALTLNAKCFEAAIEGFVALLDDIEADEIDPRPQNFAERTFYRRNQRPAAGCTLGFDASAEQLSALVRALDFGPYPNPMGLPKIALGRSFAIVTTLAVLDDASGAPPGTIAAIARDQLIITTATVDVALGGFLTIDGRPMSLAEVIECGDLRPGAILPAVEPARAARLGVLCAELSEHERFWMAQLAEARPTTLPYPLPPAGSMLQPASATLTAAIQWPGIAGCDRGGDRLLVALVAYLATLTAAGIVEVAFSGMPLRAAIGDLSSFVSSRVPLRVHVDPTKDLAQLASSLEEQLKQLHARRSYVRDAPARHPALRARFGAIDMSTWPIGVEVLEEVRTVAAEPPQPGRVLTVRLATDGNMFALRYDPGVLGPARAEQMAQEFLAFAERFPAASNTRFLRAGQIDPRPLRSRPTGRRVPLAGSVDKPSRPGLQAF